MMSYFRCRNHSMNTSHTIPQSGRGAITKLTPLVTQSAIAWFPK